MNDSVPVLIKKINDLFRLKADTMMKKMNLTFSQMRVLDFLVRNNGTARQKELEEHLQVSHPTVVGLVQRLEANGYVTTYLDPCCQRNKIISITKKAEENRLFMEKERLDGLATLFDDFSKEEETEFLRLLEKLYINIRKD